MTEQPVMNTYGRQPIAFERGEGAWLFDTNGNKFFDTISGIAVCGLGHAHPKVVKAISDQAGRLMHCSNLYNIPLQTTLADRLKTITGMEKTFFCNSGAEANEAAIKIARLYGHKQNKTTPAIIVMEGAFHGRTMATLSATGNRKVQAGFEPLLSGFVRAPFNDIKALENIAKSNHNIVAIMMEPVQGEGGVNLCDPDYLQAVRDLCDKHQWLLMFDEVQTGNGRTGAYYAFQRLGVRPDVMTTAKGLGNGFPIGACLAGEKAANILMPGSHGSTFGGNPLACAAALAVLDTIETDKLANRAKELGSRILENFRLEFEGADYIKDIRGFGMMIGIELKDPCPELVPLAKTQGLLLNVTNDRVIRLLPPLILTDDEADLLVSSIVQLVKVYAGDDRKRPRPNSD
ncbi:acetylornithine aminotransferase [Oleiphilus messinensis]|uniref:Acetylornithine aminotransferase n=1 Tax=Oleiphilus messinensis TaxID=141451 RepID=A0A1Y0I7C0_9GAMM|nr:aspartate aminotransferase family protein [Oleiphilus messinensis]ARU55293.1 acetylornithine aminotransferase [Oleiphilus messinensis]